MFLGVIEKRHWPEIDLINSQIILADLSIILNLSFAFIVVKDI